MSAIISEISDNSLAAKANLKVGDTVIGVNGTILRDIIDYQIAIEEPDIELLVGRNGNQETIVLHRELDKPVGLKFTSSVFDQLKQCQNNCVFCFLHQLPKGLRSSLYVRDDDFRLSFLYGNFITLTNLDNRDVKRIIEQKLSPLYVSLHSTDQAVRKKLLRPKKNDLALTYLDALLRSGVEVHIQVVICPGINDGTDLDNTLRTLESDFSSVKSIGLVPVGLTEHRLNLFPLKLFTKDDCKKLINKMKPLQDYFHPKRGTHWIFLADEFYLQSGEPLPSFEHYEDFSQLENGIGITRMFLHNIEEESKLITNLLDSNKQFTIITGELAAPIITEIFYGIHNRIGGKFKVLAIRNKFFGSSVTMAGLITSKDIIDTVRLENNPGKLLIPDVMLDSEDRFLDNVSLNELEFTLDIPVIKVPVDGQLFLKALMTL